MATDDGGDEDDDQWRFSLADLEDDPKPEEADEADSGGNVAGSLASRGELEPGDVDLENAAFVALGALVTALLIYSALRFALGF